jgi:tRNA-specific 2-thiouridylase
MGEHNGIAFFTIGQRRGLGVASSEPLYVLDLDPASRTVIVGPESGLYDTEIWADQVNLVAAGDLSKPTPVRARVRYRMPEAEALVWQETPDTLRLRFAQPQRAVTPGQALVCYNGDVVVAGGTIQATDRTRLLGQSFEREAVLSH